MSSRYTRLGSFHASRAARNFPLKRPQRVSSRLQCSIRRLMERHFAAAGKFRLMNAQLLRSADRVRFSSAPPTARENKGDFSRAIVLERTIGNVSGRARPYSPRRAPFPRGPAAIALDVASVLLHPYCFQSTAYEQNGTVM